MGRMGCGRASARGREPFDVSRAKLIGCATVIEDMVPIVPPGLEVEVLDFGLHLRPDDLRRALQGAIDATAADHDVVLLGYGLCSLAVVGLEARGCTLAVPRVDDCIGAFLGGREAYRALNRQEPGTYYLTKGWIEVGDTLLDTHRRVVERYGPERAERVMSAMLQHYRRVAYVDNGHRDRERHRAFARRVADRFGLAFAEVRGSSALVAKLVRGPWDDDILVVEPGATISYADFGAATRSTPDPDATGDGGTPVELGHG